MKPDITRKPRVYFVNLPTLPVEALLEGKANDDPVAMPLGILYLSSYLRKHGVTQEIGLIDYALSLRACDVDETSGLDEFILEVAKNSVSQEPDILAFSVLFSSSYDFFVKVLADLKKLWPNAITVAGGNHISNHPNLLMENDHLDYLARGEGELGFTELVRQLGQGEEINVQGIFSKEKYLGLGAPESCELAQDLDDLPYPDWELLDTGAYLGVGHTRQRNYGDSSAVPSESIPIMTSRGCPFSCTFCASYTVHGRKMRYRSPENVTGEIRALYDNYGVTLITPEDDLFTANKKRVVPLLEAIQAMNLPGVEMQFPNALSVNTLDEDVCDALINTGMKICTLAIESGVKEVQINLIKKRCDLDKAKRLVKHLKSRGSIVRCLFIVGFPGETMDQIMQSINFAKDLGADWCVFSIATPLPGTEMYDQFIKRGDITHEERAWSTLFTQRLFDTPEISAQDLNELREFANIFVNFINNPRLKEGNFKAANLLFKDVLMRFPFHVIALYSTMKCHIGLGDAAAAEKLRLQIEELVNSNPRSKEMYEKYNYLMPDLSIEAVDSVSVPQNELVAACFSNTSPAFLSIT